MENSLENSWKLLIRGKILNKIIFKQLNKWKLKKIWDKWRKSKEILIMLFKNMISIGRWLIQIGNKLLIILTILFNNKWTIMIINRKIINKLRLLTIFNHRCRAIKIRKLICIYKWVKEYNKDNIEICLINN